MEKKDAFLMKPKVDYCFKELTRTNLEEGRQRGIQQGLQEGLQQGLKQGLKQGKEAGELRVNRLIGKLLEESRFEDMEKMIQDRELQNRLFEEFGL